MNSLKQRLVVVGTLSLGLLSIGNQAIAGGLTTGNLLIYRVGDGLRSLTNTGNAVFIDEYTPSGTLVQSIPIASSGANALIASGTATSEGMLSFSNDGRYVMMAGYNTSVGGATNLTTSSSASIARTVGRLDAVLGTVDTSTKLTDFASGSNPRSVVSTNGTDLWVTGGAGGVRYTTLGSTTSTQLSTSATNLRTLNIYNNQLYTSTASGSLRIATVGTGLPTTSGQTITNLPGISAGFGSPNQFFMANLSGVGSNPDTLYVADDSAGQIQKFSLIGGNWTGTGTITAASVRGLTGTVSGNTVTLYGTTGSNTAGGGGTLYGFTDTSGAGGTASGTANVLATLAGTSNMAFRGLALIPTLPVVLPEPGTLALAAMGLGALVTRRRRK